VGVQVVHRRSSVAEQKQEIPIAIAVACAATLLVFLPFGATALHRAMSWSLYREDALGYALVLLPHAITMIACLVAPGAFALGLALGVGVVAALALVIVVPVWGIILSLGGDSHPDPMGFVLLGVVLFGIQIAMVVIAKNDLRDARESGKKGGSFGAAVGPAYVGILLLVALPITQRNAAASYAARQEANSMAALRVEVARTKAGYRASDSATITHDQAYRRMFFIVSCLSLHFDSAHNYPSDLLSLGPAGDNCLDSATASGKFDRWRVVYRRTPPERGWPNGNYELSATDTADVERPIYFGRTD
jgi:hypothetical protein